MNRNLSLDELGNLTQEAVEKAKPQEEVKLDSKGRLHTSGGRKCSVARVWLKKGTGEFMVNKKSLVHYFSLSQSNMALEPFQKTDTFGQYDVMCTVKGGGISGQAGAIRYALSKALQLMEPSLRPTLKSEGFLTRDARIVERKKPGLRKARRATQFSKR